MLLIANNPLTILDKGFSIVKDENGVIKSKDELKESKNIEIIFKDGSIKGKFNSN